MTLLKVALRQCTYHATRAEWRAVADDLDQRGEHRLAKAIKDGLASKSDYWYGPTNDIPLRFRGGSVAKLDRYSNESLP
jgi:hypothetical protein